MTTNQTHNQIAGSRLPIEPELLEAHQTKERLRTELAEATEEHTRLLRKRQLAGQLLIDLRTQTLYLDRVIEDKALVIHLLRLRLGREFVPNSGGARS